jgi:hypothetical protein
MLGPNTSSIAFPASALTAPAEKPLQRTTSLADVFAALAVEDDCEWAIVNYKRAVTEFAGRFAARRLLETAADAILCSGSRRSRNLAAK